MMRALMISATGMSAQQIAMDTISNNLANVNTTGFKTSQAKFADIFYHHLHGTAEILPVDKQIAPIGLGVRNAELQRQFTQGAIEATGNNLDVAIQGNGFFQVLKPDGSLAYTRDGSFTVSSEGILSNAQGDALSPSIEIPYDAAEINLSIDGTVSVRRASEVSTRAIGQLELAQFINPGGLESQGHNMYAATVASGEPMVNTPGQEGLGELAQGSLERSNVNMVQEMVNMILTQRAYEVNSKSIQAADEMMKIANNLRRT